MTELEFSTACQGFLAQVRADLEKDFHLIHDAELDGRTYPLFATFNSVDTRSLLNIGYKQASSYEFCYFDLCPGLDEEALRFYEDRLFHMAEHMVQWQDPTHAFSMLSFVVLTDTTPDRRLLRKLKKIRCEQEKKRKEPGFGWCSGRLCIVDLSTGAIYGNSTGKALLHRTQQTLARFLR